MHLILSRCEELLSEKEEIRDDEVCGVGQELRE
jgi:hypothetical protein